MLSFILENWSVVLGLLLGLLVALLPIFKWIAPKTHTELDDKAVSILGKLISFLTTVLAKFKS